MNKRGRGGVGSRWLWGCIALTWACSVQGESEARAGARGAQGQKAAPPLRQPLIPPPLQALSLGSSLQDLERLRPRAVRYGRADRGTQKAYEERLGDSTRALYFFSLEGRLSALQVATQLTDLAQIEPRLAEASRRAGKAPAVFDCPASPGQPPTRRYAWRDGDVMATDIYILVGEHAAATLYVGPYEDLTRSLAAAGCESTKPGQETLFPVVPQPAVSKP